MALVALYKRRTKKMSYYLKKTRLKGRTYLSIDESFYSSKTKGTAHRVYKSLGSVETLKENGMEDPVSFYQKEVDRLNEQAVSKTAQRIGESPIRFLGYFPLKSIMEKMTIPQFVRYFNLTNDCACCLPLQQAENVSRCHSMFVPVLRLLIQPIDEWSYVLGSQLREIR